MRAIFLALMLVSGMMAQTAIVPLSFVCPPPQITVATLKTTLGASAVVTLSCIALDVSVALDATVTPPTVKAATPSNTGPQVVTYPLFQAGTSGAIEVTYPPASFPPAIDITGLVPTKPGANVWTGANDFSLAAKTVPLRVLSADPLTCDATTREMYYSVVTEGIRVCRTANVWTSL